MPKSTESGFGWAKPHRAVEGRPLAKMKAPVAEVSLLNLSVYFFVAHRMFLRFDLSDIVRRTPSANPAAAGMKIKTAWGVAAVPNSRCVSTGSVFWKTRIDMIQRGILRCRWRGLE